MALNPPTYSPVPFIGYAWVRIAGVDVTTDSEGRPRFLTGFQYRRVGDRGGNRTTISLFDHTWDFIESLIASSDDQLIQFRYGYTTGKQSPTYTGYVINYKPNFGIDGAKLTVEAVSLGVIDDQDRVKSRVFKDKDIHEVVDQIAEEHGWGTDIDPTLSLYDNCDLEQSGLVKLHFYQNKMRDLQFIADILAPRAVRKSDKVADYKIFFDDESNIFHFHPPRFEKSPTRTFIFMRDKMSEVISFTPDMNGQLNLRLGAGVSGAPYIDTQTGEYNEVYHNNQTTPEKSLLGGVFTEEALLQDENYSVVENRPLRDGDQADIAARDRYFQMFNSVHGGELVILGDPDVKVHQIIRILVTKRNGAIHYSSGLYLVKEINDAIGGGDFASTLSLIRNAFPATGEVTGALGIGKVNQ